MKHKEKIIYKRLTALALSAVILAGAGTVARTQYLNAASSNRVTLVQNVKKDEELKDGKEPHLLIKLSDDLTKNNSFYLELLNAEWLPDGADPSEKINVTVDGKDIPGANFELERQRNKLMKVTFRGGIPKDADGSDIGSDAVDVIPRDATIKVNLRTKVIKGQASVIVDGNSTVVSSSEEVFAKVDGKGVKIYVAKDIPAFYESGKIAELRLEESYVGAFLGETRTEDGKEYAYVNMKLFDNDFEFTNVGGMKIKPIKGFSTVDASKIIVRSVRGKRDEIEILIPTSEITGKAEKGGFDIVDLEVVSTIKEPDTGSLTLTIDGDNFETSDVKVADIEIFTLKTTITPTNKENQKGLIAGRKGIYKVEIKETIVDTLANGRDLTFELDEGFMVDAGTRKRIEAMEIFAKEVKLPNTLKLLDVIMEDTRVIGFSAEVVAKNDAIDEYALSIPVVAPLEMVDIFEIERLPKKDNTIDMDNEDDEDESGSAVDFGGGRKSEDDEDKDKDKEKSEQINLIISGRALSNEKVETLVSKVTKPMSVSIKELALKTGLKDQKGSDIMFKEADVGMLRKGNIRIMFDNVDGLSFSKAPSVKVVSGDLRLGKGELIRDGRSIIGINFEVTRPSRKTPATVAIENVVVTADRTVPEGDTGILLSGDAIMEQGKPVESVYYVRIGALNLDDQKKEDAEKDKAKQEAEKNKVKELESRFIIGSPAYHLNGVMKQMDAAPYIEEARTMIPVRYVADALGVNEKNILFHQGVVTILHKDKIIQLKSKSNIMLMNGAQIPMDAPMTIKDGRTYVPVAYIATALESYTYFDADTKTVIFNNLKDPNPIDNPEYTSPEQSSSVDVEPTEDLYEDSELSGII